MKLGKKNPNVDTSFLPDREREREKREQREKLKKEWIEEQDKIKSKSFCSFRLLFYFSCKYIPGSQKRSLPFFETWRGGRVKGASHVFVFFREWAEWQGTIDESVLVLSRTGESKSITKSRVRLFFVLKQLIKKQDRI